MVRTTTTLVALLAICTALEAQTVKAKVLPVAATNSEGSRYSFPPFGYDASRFQQIWSGPALTSGTAVLNGINFRGDGTRGSSAVTLSSHVARIGPTTVAPGKMSTSFASNITGKMTTVFSANFKLPALAVPKNPPSGFTIKYPFSKNFLFTSTKSHLLMDWSTGNGTAQSKQAYYIDAEVAGGGGGVSSFGTTGKFFGGDVIKFTADPSKLKPNGSLDIAASGFKQIYPSFLILGLSNKTFGGPLPLDLKNIGAPGNFLYISMEIVIPFPIKASGGTNFAIFSGAIPNDPLLAGFTGYAQSYYGDPKANGAGLVSSNALALTGGGGVTTQIMGRDGTFSSSGSFWFGTASPGGPVAQFTGIIP